MHAGGIDRPLAIHKGGKAAIIPHENWRGQFSLGTYADGRRSDCTTSTVYNCTPIRWPGHRTTAWHMDQKDPEINTWYGGLVDGMRDASGQMYMRNRYYDPATGQFTQPDPIGIAGGLNSYGFAAGDPITYNDPYGLQADTIEIDKSLRPAMDECVARSAKCRAMVDSLARDDEWHRIQLGQPGDCAPYMIGCWTKTPPPGHAAGSIITVIPGEFGLVSFPIDSADVFGHEVAHGVVCGSDEQCAKDTENVIRQQRGGPPRP